MILRPVPLARSRSRGRRVPVWIRRLSGPVLLVAVWWLLTGTGLVASSTFPTIPDVLSTGSDLLAKGELQAALWSSLQRVLAGLGLGLAAGLVLAVLAGSTRLGEDVIDSGMQVIKAIPTFALVPLLIIWLGIYESPKVTLIALATSWPIYFNTFGAIRGVDRRLVEAASTLGIGRWGLVRHVILPGSLPGFLVGLRISLANAWLALVIAEEINTDSGLGRLLSDSRLIGRVDSIVLVIVVYAILGMVSYAIVKLLESRLLQWRQGYEGS